MQRGQSIKPSEKYDFERGRRCGRPIFENSEEVIEANYEVPFLYHATMEPMNYIADVKENEIECWGPTQVPGAVSYYANQITDIATGKY